MNKANEVLMDTYSEERGCDYGIFVNEQMESKVVFFVPKNYWYLHITGI